MTGAVWVTGAWREIPRKIVVDEVVEDEVRFHFDDGQISRCSITAFRRTYVPEGVA